VIVAAADREQPRDGAGASVLLVIPRVPHTLGRAERVGADPAILSR